MINKKDFLEIVDLLRKAEDRNNELNKLNVNLNEYDENYYIVIDRLFRNIFSENQYDWFNWWMYERSASWQKEPLKAYDNGVEINLDTPELLYDFIKSLE